MLPEVANECTSPLAGQPLAGARDLDAYIQTVSAFAVLTPEEERSLAERFYQHGDLDAARELVLRHLRFVVHLARGYRGYGLPEADLIQEGNVGLMKAVKRFNPEVGRPPRLLRRALDSRAEMHEFILRNWRIVKVATTKAQRKLFFNLRGSKKKLGWLNAAENPCHRQRPRRRPRRRHADGEPPLGPRPRLRRPCGRR